MRVRTVSVFSMALLVACVFTLGCKAAPKKEEDRAKLQGEAKQAIVSFKAKDAPIKKFFSGAHGYAVFPSVGKGAVGVGGAYGRGILYRNGKAVGYCTLSQATIGFQLGGQAYSEVIFFETKAKYIEFKTGNFAFSAQASAVALASGASADAKYANGVLVFTQAAGGLMFEASIGGQKFNFEAMD